MNLTKIRSLARDAGVKPGKMRKADLIRSIQRSEGYFDCFASAIDGECDQRACVWREDCFVEAKKARAA
ncbi:MAG TPA: SAP domain-containing protein [Gammaproteobacteria bacterium]|nr:SAP domain-containing protein [Gammaproteobacteria bacterium]